ncbi:uncharacterized protein PHACADRAFT_31801 [Phanerochaete carnosa HHB-10118-sp]|uniref:Uncharacterized protein n=1 Tax=Phanerochaete carnosa (strain HHB-10118-sp) TaxID=650164 RepID=K5VYW2_PHACS|nr:uncharacterized protein PHACADRAFT_31801 [Phanerochaete carnosa HHB-10118-sp]EKM52020.1 hypothetical protein PHACADRAFT_31801 [Phanerochaete carnosa HHB-10118-sp]
MPRFVRVIVDPQGAYDFYIGLTQRTKGLYEPMADPGPFRKLATGFAFKAIDSSRFCAQYKRSIHHHAFVKKRAAHDIAADLHAHLTAEGAHHHDISVPGVYEHHEEGSRDARIWATARTLRDAKQQVSQPEGSRLAPAHRSGGHYPVTSAKIPITRDHVVLVSSHASLSAELITKLIGGRDYLQSLKSGGEASGGGGAAPSKGHIGGHASTILRQAGRR